VLDNRLIFDTETLHSRIRGEKKSSCPPGEKKSSCPLGERKRSYACIPLGEIHGLELEAVFDVFKAGDGNEKPLGRMKVTNRKARISTLQQFGPYKPFDIPNPFYVTRIGFPTSFSCFCRNDELRLALEQESAINFPGLQLRDDEGSCDISVIREPGRVVISRSHSNRPHRHSQITISDDFNYSMPIGAKLSASDVGKVHRILINSAYFYHHLTRGDSTSSNVELGLWYLEEDYDECLIPASIIPLEKQACQAAIDIGINTRHSLPVGMTMTNGNEFGLQPYVFYFNPQDLKIGKFQS
jgi:hypothetical protein